MRITLEDLGYNKKFEQYRIEHNLNDFEIGRVVSEHAKRYVVKTVRGDLDAEITGTLRYSAESREDLPAVGDWVSLKIYDDGLALINDILPRTSVLKRHAVGRTSKLQIIAANVDYAFLVQSVEGDFNINRLERYLTVCHSSDIRPIIILSKIDLISQEQIAEITEGIKQRVNNILVLAISNETREGYEALEKILEHGMTYCMLGSSGVGKSTLLNNLSGHEVMRTNAIRKSSSKGRHITSHRELFVLETGGILIDNPGMREIGITESGSGFETTFDKIIELTQYCKFNDCTHTNEIGCAVREALESGELDQETYKNYITLEREKTRLETSAAERRKKEKKFGKRLKNYKKNKYKNR
jgi:ribosome biogenesis GTPase